MRTVFHFVALNLDGFTAFIKNKINWNNIKLKGNFTNENRMYLNTLLNIQYSICIVEV